MTKDENGAWIYEELNVQLNGNDSFEYWLFVENNNLGYVTNGVIKIGGLFNNLHIVTLSNIMQCFFLFVRIGKL